MRKPGYIMFWIEMRLFLFTFLLSGTLLAQSQLDSGYYLIQLKDKANNPYSLQEPGAYLSQRSITRRSRQMIGLDSTDLPVTGNYVLGIGNTGAQVIHVSKWLNAVLVHCNSAELDSILSLPFVVSEDRIAKIGFKGIPFPNEEFFSVEADQHKLGRNDYGETWSQTSMLRANVAHDRGYTGEDIWIGVFDSGFDNVDSMTSFAQLRESGGIVYAEDMVERGSSVYDEHRHGTYVLSTMAGSIENQYRGMALSSKYLLFRTEDVSSETRLEEINWVVAAEVADSLGVDIINTSLSYKDFDGDVVADYTPGDMDGRTSYIAQGNIFAHRKGILCVSSAGNDGAQAWNTVGTPADADSIITVGSVDSNEVLSWFSSLGPTADGRIKPDVVAMGQLAAVIAPSDVILRGNGTSFSGPILAGFASCVWSKYRDLTNYELRDLILRSSSYAYEPNNEYGYGIPNFLALSHFASGEPPSDFVKFFPNPIYERWTNIKYTPELLGEDVEIEIFNSSGEKLITVKTRVDQLEMSIDLSFLGSLAGMYYFRLRCSLGTSVDKLIILN